MAVDFILSALMVTWGWSVWEVERWRGALSTVLSGALLPLTVLPWNLGEVLVWLPPAAMAWAPLSVYTGTGDAPRLLAVQAGWVLVLGAGARWLWRRSRQRVVVYGG
jgi:ABC-2 type transport system permease protein